MGKLDGKVAFITGGARGQGRAHAVRLAEEGAQIVICDIAAQVDSVLYPMATPEDLAETTALVEETDQRCVAVQADVRDAEQVNGAVAEGIAQFGRIDIAVINHGICTPGSWDTPAQTFIDCIDTNLTGAFLACQAVIPHMIAQGDGGSIIATSSGGGIRASQGVFAYGISKHGLVGMTRCLAVELAPHNIRVNAICPGAVATPMTQNDMFLSLFSGVKSGGTLETADLGVRGLSLLANGWLEPRDIANAVCFLASDEARYITGIEMPVDLGTNGQPSGIPPVVGAALSAALANRWGSGACSPMRSSSSEPDPPASAPGSSSSRRGSTTS